MVSWLVLLVLLLTLTSILVVQTLARVSSPPSASLPLDFLPHSGEVFVEQKDEYDLIAEGGGGEGNTEKVLHLLFLAPSSPPPPPPTPNVKSASRTTSTNNVGAAPPSPTNTNNKIKPSPTVNKPSSTTTSTTNVVKPQFSYYGGPLIQNVKVVPVFWNNGVVFPSELTTFLKAYVGPSPYFTATFSQYATSVPKQTIKPGTVSSPFVDANQIPAISDSDVQARLKSLISNGLLPTPTADHVYVLFLPPGFTVSRGSYISCKNFCAYHWSFALTSSLTSSSNVKYMVIPDFGDDSLPASGQSGCFSFCGKGTVLERLQQAVSHETIEALTDPMIGGVKTFAAPLAWYSATLGELADPCNFKRKTAVLADGNSYVVQQIWDNLTGGCT